MRDFVHLRCHTDLSVSEGASGYKAFIETALKAEMPALAITDRENLYGAMTFSEYVAAAGIQPIVGCKFYMDLGRGKRGSIILLSQTADGYVNLCSILRAAHEPRMGENGKEVGHPGIDFDMLERHAEGLILLTGGGEDGLLPTLVAGKPEMADETFRWLLSVFGDRLYVEICRNGRLGEAGSPVEEALVAMAYGAGGAVECLDGVVRLEAPLVATSDVWYATPDRHRSWLILRASSGRSNLITMDGDDIVGSDDTLRHLRTGAEMAELFSDLPEALRNTAAVARRCAFMVNKRSPILPPFACGDGRTENDELRHQSEVGLDARLARAGIVGPAEIPYRERLAFELSVIGNMGFPGYFLIVADFIQWAKSKDIPVGPGRGSGAGSVVAWALTITDLNPLEFGLLFERFLNPERVSMPDFDIDFCQDRREEVVRYVRDRYGAPLVSQIVALKEIKGKTALKDAGRSVIHKQHGQYSYGEMNEISKLVPVVPGEVIDLRKAYELGEEFRNKVNSSPKYRVLYELALGIEGLYREVSPHAAGIIIGDRPLHELAPITMNAKNGMPICQYNMKGAESAGLVKFDFLGLTTLSIMRKCVAYIEATTGEKLELAAIPRHDDEVFEQFRKGNTSAVFQFEKGGMRNALRMVKPTRLEDLIAVNALYRPGPMAYIPNYAARKNGTEEFGYYQPVEKTKAFLEETYGIMVYQEQVMLVAQTCAGYSLGGADLLRRAMGKKIKSEMDKQRTVFIYGDAATKVPGAIALGMAEKVAHDLFDDITKFAEYGFNKSHAAAYAWVGYQTMWLKVHYPAQFLAAVMSYNTANADTLSGLKDECDALGIPLLLPDVNKSEALFTPEPCAEAKGGLAIRFGLTAIKKISDTTGNLTKFTEDRKANGPFANLEDVAVRAQTLLSKSQMERLAEAGAFDGLTMNRRQAAETLGWLVEKRGKAVAKAVPGQSDMFGGAAAATVPPNMSEIPEWGDVTDREFRAVGFYFSKHPIDPYGARLRTIGVRRRRSVNQFMVERGVAEMKNVKLCVMIDDVGSRTTSTGTAFISAQVSEKEDAYNIACYPWKLGCKPEELRSLLEGAKSSRKPVVFVASMSMSAKGDGNVWVNGVDAWDVDLALEGIRGEITVKLDPNLIDPVPDERAAMLAAEDDPVKMETVKAAAAKRWTDKIEAAIASTRNAEGTAQHIIVKTPTSTRRLPGRYKLTSAVYGILQGMNGVTSIREDNSDDLDDVRGVQANREGCDPLDDGGAEDSEIHAYEPEDMDLAA